MRPSHVLQNMSDDTTAMVKAIGEQLADHAVAFLVIVKALRSQPGFDNSIFMHEIKEILERDDLSPTQRNILSSLL